MKNIAFIDGQNLHKGITEQGWMIDHKKFRTYLKDTYNVDFAYYHFGYLNEDLNSLYTSLQKAGFIIVFREHSPTMKSVKKGNVDTDIVFEMMKTYIDEREEFGKIILVAGDGDYFKAVQYLISKDAFERILFPNGNKASSLYNSLSNDSKLSLNRVRNKLEYKK